MDNGRYVQQFPTTGSGDEYVVLQPDGRIRLSTQLRNGFFENISHVSIFTSKEDDVIKDIVIKPMDVIDSDDRVELLEAGERNSKRYFAITGKDNASYVINANRTINIVQPERVTLTLQTDSSGEEPPAGNQEPGANEYQLKGYRYQMKRCNELAVYREGNEHKDLGKCIIISVDECVDDNVRYKSAGSEGYPSKTVKVTLVEECSNGWD